MSSPISFHRRVFSFLQAPFENYAYLSFLRIFISLLIIKKLLYQWPYLTLLFSGSGFVHWSPKIYGALSSAPFQENYRIIASIYLLLAVLMGLGVGGRLTTFSVFIATDLWQRMDGYFLNGGDNLLKFVLLYLSLCNCRSTWALPKWSRSPFTTPDDLDVILTRIGFTMLTLHFCLVYTVSALYKMHADVWFEGVAVYYTLNIERFMGTPINHLLSLSAPFVIGVTYITLLWELLLPILIWHRKWKWPIIALGVALHGGMYVFMMIHDFEILFIVLLGMFCSDTEWASLFARMRRIFRPDRPRIDTSEGATA